MAIDPQQQHNLHFVDPFLFYEVEWSVKDNTRRVPEIYLTARQTNLIQQRASRLMVETAVSLDITRYGRFETLSWRSNPINDGAFQTLCVIGSCTRHSFLYL